MKIRPYCLHIWRQGNGGKGAGLKRERTIGYEVRTLSNLIKRHVGNSEIMQKIESTSGVHGWVIGYLYEHRDRDVFQKDFEEEFQIRRSTATEIMKLMEKNGLIVREKVEHDGRLKRIVLTERAIACHEAFSAYIESFEKSLVDGIPEEDLNTFFAVIRKIKENIDYCP